MQFHLPSDSETAAPVLPGNCASSSLKSPGFPGSLPSLVVKKTGLTCAPSVAVPAPRVRLPKPLDSEEELLHSPLELVLKFLLDFPIKNVRW